MKHISEINPTAAFPQAVRERIANEVAKIAPTKHCSGPCKSDKPLTDYYRKRDSSDGRQDKCKACAKEAARKRYAEHSDAIYRQKRDRDAREKRWQDRLAAMKAGVA